MLRKIGSFYACGAKTVVDSLDLSEMELPGGGTLRISLLDVPPQSMKDLGELFETLEGLVKMGDNTEGYLTVKERSNGCPFMKELDKEKLKKDREKS